MAIFDTLNLNGLGSASFDTGLLGDFLAGTATPCIRQLLVAGGLLALRHCFCAGRHTPGGRNAG